MGGLASSGQLGVGGLSSDVYTLSGKSNVVRTDGQIASNVLSMTSSVGGVHSAYADSDGYVWAFGKNDKGSDCKSRCNIRLYNSINGWL